MLLQTFLIFLISNYSGLVLSVTGASTSISKIICEYQSQTINCPASSVQFMNITYANYGRLSSSHCPTSSQVINCSSEVSLVVVRQKCHGLNSCTLAASNSVFGDPCRTVVKYLEVRYTCVSADSFPSLSSLGHSYVYDDLNPNSYVTTIKRDRNIFIEYPYYYTLFNITQIQLTVQGNPSVYNNALSFLNSSITTPSQVSGTCMPNMNDFASEFCIYRDYGYLHLSQTFLPVMNPGKSYNLGILVRDSSLVPVVRKASLIASVVPKCFPMTELYQAVRIKCKQNPVSLSFPANLPWSGSLYGNNIPISIASSTIIAMIFINVNLLANFYESTSSGEKYTITFWLKDNTYERTFYYSRTSQTPLNNGLPQGSGNHLNINIYPLIELKQADKYVNISLKLIHPRNRTNIVFNSQNAVKLYGSKKITTCPGSECLDAYRSWMKGVDMLRFTSKDSCIQDDFQQEAYLQPCGREPKFGYGKISNAAPGGSIIYDIKNQIDFGHFQPTFFQVINSTVQGVSYPGYSSKYFCATSSFNDKRKFVCLNRYKGLLRIKSGTTEELAQITVSYTFTLEVQVTVTVNGAKSFQMCVITVVLNANDTAATTAYATTVRVLQTAATFELSSTTILATKAAATTTKAAATTTKAAATTKTTTTKIATATTTKQQTTNVSPTTTISTPPTTKIPNSPTPTIMPISLLCNLAQSCQHQYKILSPERYSSSGKLIYRLESVLSSVRFRLWSVNIVAVSYGHLILEVNCLNGLHNIPIANASADLTNHTNTLILDVDVPKGCDRIKLLMSNVSNHGSMEVLSNEVNVTVSLATFHSCDNNQCVELYKLWNVRYNGSFCPGTPFSRYSVCFDTLLLVVPQSSLFYQPIQLSCKSSQISYATWHKDNLILQSRDAVLSLSGTVYEDQGYYTCSTQNNGKQLSSRKILFKFQDVYTSTIYMEIINSKYTNNLGDKTSQEFVELRSQLVQSLASILSTLPSKRPHSINVEKFSGSSTILAEIKIYSNVLDQTTIEAFYSQLKDLLVSGATGNNFDSLRIASETIVVLNHEYCLPETTNKGRSKGPYSWPITKSQRSVSVKCTNGPKGMQATRVCAGNFTTGAFWQSVKDDECNYNSKTTQELDNLAKVVVNSSNAVTVAAELEKLTKSSTSFSSDDTVLASQTFSNIAAVNVTSDKIIDDLLLTASNLLNVNETALSSSQSQGKALTNIIKGIESLADKITLPNKAGQPVVKVSSGVAIQAVMLDNTSKSSASFAVDKPTFNSSNVISNQKFQAADVDIGISLPDTIVSDVKTKAATRLSFVAYKGGQFFQSSRVNAFGQRVRDVSSSPNSMVISAHVKGEKRVSLSKPLNGTFKKISKSLANKCAFWDFNANDGYGAWSSSGCRQLTDKDNRVICQCDHMTNFAILFDVYAGTQKSVDPEHEKILGIISFIGIGLSLGGLSITLITLLLFRRLRRHLPSKILIHLCFSLMLTLACFVIGADMTRPVYACRGFAIAIQYFLLVCFSWMVVEAVNLYLSFVVVMGTYISKFMVKAGIFAWGLPIIIVSFTAWQRFGEYGNDNYCVVTGWAAYGTLFAPICLAILLNFIAFGMVLHSLRSSAKGKKITKDQRRSGLSQLRIAATFSCILGLTWVFGLFAIADARIAFQYLFCIFNSLQGFTIFYLHVARQKEARNHWIHFLTGNGLNYYRSSVLSTSKGNTMKPPRTADKRDRITSTESANTLTSTLKSSNGGTDTLKLSSIVNGRLDSTTSTASET